MMSTRIDERPASASFGHRSGAGTVKLFRLHCLHGRGLLASKKWGWMISLVAKDAVGIHCFLNNIFQ